MLLRLSLLLLLAFAGCTSEDLAQVHVIGPAWASHFVRASTSGRVQFFHLTPGSLTSECACVLDPSARLVLVTQPVGDSLVEALREPGVAASGNTSLLARLASGEGRDALARLVCAERFWRLQAKERQSGKWPAYSVSAERLRVLEERRALAAALRLRFHPSLVQLPPPLAEPLSAEEQGALDELLRKSGPPAKQSPEKWKCAAPAGSHCRPKPPSCALGHPLRGRDVCAVWLLWGSASEWKAKNMRALESSVSQLKALNPGVHTIVFSDEPAMLNTSADEVRLINPMHGATRLAQPPRAPSHPAPFAAVVPKGARQWTTRLYYTSTVQCHAVLTLDSTVTTCGETVMEQALELADQPDFVFGSNVEHDLYNDITPLLPHHELVPHAFALLFAPARAALLFREWLFAMFEEKGLVGDDQTPLHHAAQRVPGLRRFLVNESFFGAFLSMSRVRFGFSPRFTYRIDGPATLWHTHSEAAVPQQQHMCDFLNGPGWLASLRNKSLPPLPTPASRIVIQLNQSLAYSLLHTREQCTAALAPYVNGTDVCGHSLMLLPSEGVSGSSSATGMN